MIWWKTNVMVKFSVGYMALFYFSLYLYVFKIFIVKSKQIKRLKPNPTLQQLHVKIKDRQKLDTNEDF